MKFEEASLIRYLVENLTPLTEADPAILAEYVVALLKKDQPAKELEQRCTDSLAEFLGLSTEPFVVELFEALENGSILGTGDSLDATKESRPDQSSEVLGSTKAEGLASDRIATSSGSSSDSQDKEVSDDDDDDRNHKHRRREAHSALSHQDEEQAVRRPNRKRNKPCDNGHRPSEDDPHKESNSFSEGNDATKRRPAILPRASLDTNVRPRGNQSFRNNRGPYFDLATSSGRLPLGRGRGRGVPWNQQDSRFNPLDTLDFASQMASQGPPHPGLFVGTGLAGAANAQTASWGSFGFMPGMPRGILDPLHPLGLAGTMGPTVNPPMNLGLSRQRCRDFEERGFCLRGDMCPMEHGVNRIVVEDVQSLSQFNLPVSLSSARAPGLIDGPGPLPSVAGPSSHSNKIFPNKSGKAGVQDGSLPLDVVLPSGGCDQDVYDPDQPLLSNERSATSNSLLGLPSSNIGDEPSWDAEASGSVSVSENTSSSVWGRVRSGMKSRTAIRVENNVGGPAYPETEVNDHEEPMVSAQASHQAQSVNAGKTDSKRASNKHIHRLQIQTAHNNVKPLPKASRTLYVHGIPQKDNKKEILLSHFRNFGQVIDIYIPMNSEKAFVQFSTRDEAEAALKAPDAVMGNRFIKLWWANRDRIQDEGKNTGKPQPLQRLSVASAPASQTRSSGPTSEAVVPASSPLTSLKENGPATSSTIARKAESLEILREEIRKKQELLAQKRDEFRRQLDKFEKQAVLSNKGEMVLEQAVKRAKVEDSIKTGQPKVSTEASKLQDKRDSTGGFVPHVSNANPTTTKEIRQMDRLPVPTFNRFKLDNRPTSFRVLSPLPTDLENEASLKEHFSPFGEILSIVLEYPEVCSETLDSQQVRCSSACISFATRHAAEKAFLAGKTWKGHSLRLVWLTPKSSNASSSHEESLSPKVSTSFKVQDKPLANGSSVSPESPTRTSGMNVPEMEVKHVASGLPVEPNSSLPTSQSVPAEVSLEKSSLDDSVVEDGINTTYSQLVGIEGSCRSC